MRNLILCASKFVKWFPSGSAIALLVAYTSVCAHAQDTKASAKPAAHRADNAAQIARGKYLVEGVAMCGMCHTQHDARGQADANHPLEGAALWLNPSTAIPNWPLRAPRIGGTPPATNEQMVTLLTTGVWIDGKNLRAPMTQFRMTREDAEAVVVYLRSMGAR